LENIARLALHANTADSEWQAAAVAFFRTLRAAKAGPEVLFPGLPTPKSENNSKAPRGHYFPFGKYKNVPLDLVPADYLDWALANLKRLSPRFRAAIEQELDGREGS
jgi:hypothetical protein